MAGQIRVVFTIALGLFLALFLQARQAERTFAEQSRTLEKRLFAVLDTETKELVRPLFLRIKKETTWEYLKQFNNALSSLYLRLLPGFAQTMRQKYERDFRNFALDPKKAYSYLGLASGASRTDVCEKIKEKVADIQSSLRYEQRRSDFLAAKKRMLQEQLDEFQNDAYKQAVKAQLHQVEVKQQEVSVALNRLKREQKLVRQIRFYIGHPLGKQEYDAYINGSLDALVISEKKSGLKKIGEQVKRRNKKDKIASLQALLEQVMMSLAKQIGTMQSDRG